MGAGLGPAPTPATSTERMLSFYRAMVRIRVFEDKVHEMFLTGQMQGTTHACNGQEAVSVGAIAAMRPGDVQTNTFRGHGEALALGMDPEAAFAELIGRATGCARGLGGSMHLIDFSRGNIGSNAIVGAGIPIALGAAMAFKVRGEARVALAFFGDGATNIGSFHETLNMAAVWRAPLVLIITNNLYAEYSPLGATTATEDLARRADPFGFPGVIVDGQDVVAVHATTAEAVERARSGAGPSLLEMKTYRYRGHSRADPAKYRPEGELERWIARDPIELLGARLAQAGALTAEERSATWERARAAMEDAAARAATAPYPTLEEAARCVYAD